MKRRKLAVGIYSDSSGISVVYHDHGRPIETRFPRGSSLARLTAWRDRQIEIAQATVRKEPRGSLARDAVRFLKTRKGRPNYITEKANLKAWVRALGNPPRRKLRRQAIEEVLAAWRHEGYSDQTLRHRCLILRRLFHVIDGKTAPTPFDEMRLPPKSRPRPTSVSDTVVRAVAIELVKHEILKHLKDAKTRARYLVMASTGRRPSEVKRARREDVDFEQRLWFVRTGKGGPASALPLNDDMLAAWQLFADAQAWGAFDTRNFVRVLRRCGWPKGVRPYTLRHSTALALVERGADIGDIQAALGHASIETTRTYYAPAIESRQARIGKLLEGRIGPSMFIRPPAPKKRA